MKAKELANELLKSPESEVLCGAWNGHVETYGVVDHVYKFKFGELSNDFYGTPGRMDSRLLTPEHKDEDDIFYVGSKFGRIPNKDVDFGDDNIDYEISKINGEEGDPDLVWKLSGFSSKDGKHWEKEGEGWKVEYDTTTKTLDSHNYRESLRFVGKVIGIETLCDILKLCKIGAGIRA